MPKFDEPIPDAMIKSYAESFTDFDADTRKKVRTMFHGKQSSEFYRGVLAGMAASYMLVNNTDVSAEDFASVSASIVTYLARCEIDGVVPGTHAKKT